MNIVIQLPRDINKFCRTCMAVNTVEGDCYENYIIVNNTPTNLSQILEGVTSLHINGEDGLPATICNQCVELLAATSNFIKQCKAADAKLRNLLALSDEVGKDEESPASQVVLNDVDNENLCKICCEAFNSYYALSVHMIEHNSGKSLTDRFVKSRDDVTVCVDDDEVDGNVLGCVRKRKLLLKDNLNDDLNHIHKEEMIEISECNLKEEILEIFTEPLVKTPRIKCKSCFIEFKTRKDLTSHICINFKKIQRNIKKKDILACTLCNDNFPDLCRLSLHFLNHSLSVENMVNTCNEAEYFFCEFCGEIQDSESNILKHYIEKHNSVPSWTCENCAECFDNESDWLYHRPQCHTNEIICFDTVASCVLCNNIYDNRDELLKHSAEHLLKKYNCKKCSTSFCTQQSYSEHAKAHADDQYPCPTCRKVLFSKGALKKHVMGVHSTEEEHKCPKCPKSFATAFRLRTHVQTHEQSKKHICSYCGYSAHRIGDLQTHIRTHTSERPYKCTYAKCTATFKTSSHLCDHVRRHLQIRKHKCNVCFLTFSTGYGLKIHHMLHTGEKPFSCNICHQKFRRKYHVKMHMRIHEQRS